MLSSLDPQREAIVWSAIVRDDVLLVQSRASGEVELNDTAAETARGLLNKPLADGWATFSLWPWSIQAYRGLRIHVYDIVDGRDVAWIFCCVYHPVGCSKRQAQVFLEKMVVITELFRSSDEVWRKGSHHACEEVFADILRQRMLDIDEASMDAEDRLAISRHAIASNRSAEKAREAKLAQEKATKKVEEEALLRQMEEMNRLVAEADRKSVSKRHPTPGFDASTVSSDLSTDSLSVTRETECRSSHHSIAATSPLGSKQKSCTAIRQRLSSLVKTKRAMPDDSSEDSIENALRSLEREACRPVVEVAIPKPLHLSKMALVASLLLAVIATAAAVYLSRHPNVMESIVEHVRSLSKDRAVGTRPWWARFLRMVQRGRPVHAK